ncbi:tRNA epoxyqueuosine(34) reductase QueG [Dehalococcoidia bacterium]|nr:tRNA epoxyqueuosine(34) reductase QueG [Dehalococcoidia bacterium]
MLRRNLAKRVKSEARMLGFDPVGITSAEPFFETATVVSERSRAGLMDGLPWYTEDRARRGCFPNLMLSEVRSIIALGLDYQVEPLPLPSDGRFRGKVSRYAWNRDYHHVFEERVKQLIEKLKRMGGQSAKFYVDYGPMPDRAVAFRAGLGWHGKNTNLLTTKKGSWVFLGEVLTDLDLEPDQPLKKSCGSCIRCIPACPTGAIVSPYVLDNKRCISYHTIENRGPIPRELRAQFGDWVFGCDICQDVCPVNHRVAAKGDPAFSPKTLADSRPDLVELLEMTEEDFQERYRGSPLRRAKRVGLQRNACVALGNIGDKSSVPALARALNGAEPLVRGHAAWALGRVGGAQARQVLLDASLAEKQELVIEEIAAALDDLTKSP